jgi:hypothetical protein
LVSNEKKQDLLRKELKDSEVTEVVIKWMIEKRCSRIKDLSFAETNLRSRNITSDNFMARLN